MSETDLRDLFTRDDHAEPPLPPGFTGTSLTLARRRASHRRRSRLAVAGVAVLAAAAVTAALATAAGPAAHPGHQRQRAAAPGTAQVLLDRVALAADTTVTVRGDQFIYSDVTLVYPPKAPEREQLWSSVDNSKEGQVIRDGKTSPVVADFPANLKIPNYQLLTTLPTDPAKLLDTLRAQVSTIRKDNSIEDRYTDDDLLWEVLTSLVQQPVMPPGLATAVYQVASKVPNITLVQDTTDAAGRHGIGISHATPEFGDASDTWIFDAKTYRYLGGRNTGKDGTTNGLTALVTSGVVDRVGELPR